MNKKDYSKMSVEQLTNMYEALKIKYADILSKIDKLNEKRVELKREFKKIAREVDNRITVITKTTS